MKEKVKRLLKQYRPTLYYHMPVQNGMGSPTLDFVGWLNGHAFAIETKAPGKKPTPRQQLTMDIMFKAGAAVFVIDGDETLEYLREWLTKYK